MIMPMSASLYDALWVAAALVVVAILSAWLTRRPSHPRLHRPDPPDPPSEENPA